MCRKSSKQHLPYFFFIQIQRKYQRQVDQNSSIECLILKSQSFLFNIFEMPVEFIPKAESQQNKEQDQIFEEELDIEKNNEFFEQPPCALLSFPQLGNPELQESVLPTHCWQSFFQAEKNEQIFQQSEDLQNDGENLYKKQNFFQIHIQQSFSDKNYINLSSQMGRFQRSKQFESEQIQRSSGTKNKQKKRNNQNLSKHYAAICRNSLQELIGAENSRLIDALKSKQSNYPTIIHTFQIAERKNKILQFESLFMEKIIKAKQRKTKSNPEEKQEMRTRVLKSLELFKLGEKYQALKLLFRQRGKCPSKQEFMLEFEIYNKFL